MGGDEEGRLRGGRAKERELEERRWEGEWGRTRDEGEGLARGKRREGREEGEEE